MKQLTVSPEISHHPSPSGSSYHETSSGAFSSFVDIQRAQLFCGDSSEWSSDLLWNDEREWQRTEVDWVLLVSSPSFLLRIYWAEHGKERGKGDEFKRGDVPKAIQCYMGEAKASVNDACGFIDLEMNEIWKKMNKVRLEGGSPFSGTFIEAAMNIARVAQCIYQHGDRHGVKNL
nr:terpene synthase 10-like [Ipomoea batatas]